MNLKDLVREGPLLLSMSPEDLSAPILRTLNAVDDQRRGRNSGLEQFSISNYCNQQAGQYSDVPTVEASVAISVAFQYLVTSGMLTTSPFSNNAGWFVLTARAKSVRDDTDYKRFQHAAKYPRGSIHSAIEELTFVEFMRGDYETAVFKAFKLLEDLVRNRSGIKDELGVSLMRLAFKASRGPLSDKSENVGEQEALMHLMAGAIGRFRNPATHRFTGWDDPIAAIEILQLASLLVRIAEQR